MDIKNIKILLHSFYEGETTLEDENVLYNFFLQEDVPRDMLSEKKIFLKLHSEQSSKVPLHLENKLNSLIDCLELDTKKETKKTSIINLSKAKSRMWSIGIAASIIVILSIGIFTDFGDHQQKSNIPVDTYSNPQEAYIETQKALLLVSNKLNKGIEQIEKVNGIIDKNVQL